MMRRVLQASGSAWPVAAALGLVFGLVALFVVASLRANDGIFVYAQDDPYIHLALARTLATDGVWGLWPGEFAGASSSPTWTLLLALLWPFGGPSGLWPLALNTIGAACVVVALEASIRPSVPDRRLRGAILCATVLVLPLPTLVLIGMEHTFHVAAVVAFCAAAARQLEGGASAGAWGPVLGLAVLTGGLRYEGLFVVAVVAVLFVWKGRWQAALVLGIAAALPALVYAVYAMSQGAPPLPNSVLMKSGAERFGSIRAFLAVLTDWVGLLWLFGRPAQAILVVATLIAVALRTGRCVRVPPPLLPASSSQEERVDAIDRDALRPWDSGLVLAAVFIGTALLHAALVKLEWFYRYEAYVIALGCIAVVANVTRLDLAALVKPGGDWRRTVRRAAVLACAAVLALPLVRRGMESALVTTRASHEVYLQQYQMGLFFREHYAGAAVALNDIGAVSWLAPVRVVDVVGLGSGTIADARRAGRMDTRYLADVVAAERVQAIAVYEGYLLRHGDLPAWWRRAGEWRNPPAYAVSGDRVAFFAPGEQAAAKLATALQAFRARLPSGTRLVVER